jgi:hypothetical protein
MPQSLNMRRLIDDHTVISHVDGAEPNDDPFGPHRTVRVSLEYGGFAGT